MKISNSKKELARIISENGGWREGEFAAQDKTSARIDFYKEKPWINGGQSNWNGDYIVKHKMYATEVIHNWHQTILSRAEYFHLYPAPDADGWIEHDGKHEPAISASGLTIWCKWSDGLEQSHEANMVDWIDDSDVRVVAYRLHKPEHARSTAAGDDETNLAAKEELEATEYRPSIEQLAADYRNKLDCANRKQQEADDAKAATDAALGDLVAAGEALGLVIGFSNPEPELVITDWRDLLMGDEIVVFDFDNPDNGSERKTELMSGICVVMRVGACVHIELKSNLPKSVDYWNANGVDKCKFRFIRRP